MPIYAYKCSACGFAKDVLQKIADVPLSVCPACGAAAFDKQLTAAGFQLKGSGWYVTDFRDGAAGRARKNADKAPEAAADGKPADSAPAASGDAAAPASAPAPAPAGPAASPAPASSPAAAKGK